MRLAYAPRPGQQRLVDTVRAAQAGRSHAVIEAATGSGKTAALLAASLDRQHCDGPVVYLTRTNAQQTQVMVEQSALRGSGQDPGLVIPMMGRRHYCPLLKDDERFRDGTPEELGKLCRDARRKATIAADTGKDVEGACPYYRRLLADGTGPVEALLREGGMDPQQLASRITGCGSCPYEALKALLPEADMVVAPYVFMIDASLRQTFAAWLGRELADIHIIVDEAHNLPDAARDHHSPRLAQATLARACQEAEAYQDPVLAGRTLTTSLLHALQAAIADLADEHIKDGDDGRVPPGALEEALMARLCCPSTHIAHAARDLETWGQVIREDRRSKGRLPRSYLGAVGAFLRMWTGTADAPYAHLVMDPEDPSVEAYLLDPASVLAWLRECASSVHVSGTLAPLQQHLDLCDLPEDTVTDTLHEASAGTGLRVVGVKGIDRRWSAHQDDPRLALAQLEVAKRLLGDLEGKTALFFPSHMMLAEVLASGFFDGMRRPLFAERPGLSQAQLMGLVDGFRASPRSDALLLGVLGGRITEGLDFPGDALENALIFGIPYPPPSARLDALIHHMDLAHDGKGWTYAVHNPVGRVLRQAIGRIVRGPDDTGSAFILDERAARFRTHVPALEMVSDPCRLPEAADLEAGFQRAGGLDSPLTGRRT